MNSLHADCKLERSFYLKTAISVWGISAGNAGDQRHWREIGCVRNGLRLVFFFLGPRLLRAVSPIGWLGLAIFFGAVRWGVLALRIDVVALGPVQPLHGFTFASVRDSYIRRRAV